VAGKRGFSGLAGAGDKTHLSADRWVKADAIEMAFDHVAILTDVLKKVKAFLTP
jgi:hypothetical protein